MSWQVIFADEFMLEFEAFPEILQNELLVHARLLETYGPNLGRPHVDTLNGSRYPNMKELRFNADNGVWRCAFAFDPERKAVFLCVGDKRGINEKRFYKRLIATADERFAAHLNTGWK